VDTTTCRRCGRPIVLALIVGSQKRMPIDPAPRPDDDEYANIAVSGDHLGSVYARVISKAEPYRVTERRHTTHFATCPVLLRRRRRMIRGGRRS
jgi:hypothetical protein